MTAPSAVRFATDNDADASRVACVLEALGFEATRVTDPGHNMLGWRIDWVKTRHKLTIREAEVLTFILTHAGDGDVGVLRAASEHFKTSRATMKWHQHNIFEKLGTSSTLGLFRLVLDVKPTTERPL